VQRSTESTSRFRTVTGAAAACLVAVPILFFNLGGYALWDPDEARHAEIAREVFTAADWRGWIVPSFNFRPYHDKPILFYWLVSAAYAAGGVSELAARSVPALAALITVLTTYLWAARTWGVGAGVAAAVVLATAAEFAALGRYANLDMLLTLWITLGLLAVYRWTRRADASLEPAAACAALGMLTKGLVAPVLIGGIGVVYLAAIGRLRLLGRARLLRCALVFLAVAGPWYVVAGLLNPDYLHELFVRHHYLRFFHSARYLHPGPIYYYVPMLVACFFPWSVLLPATFTGTLTRSQRGPAEIFCLCWALGVVVFFSLSKGKLGTYILPSLPPLALLTGRYVSELVQRPSLSASTRWLVGGGALVAAFAYLCATPVLVALSSRIYNGVWVHTSFLAAVAIPMAAALLLLLHLGRHQLTPIALGGGILVCLGVFYQWAAPQISAVRSEVALAELITADAPRSAAAPIVAYSVRTPSLLFYLRRPVQEIDRPRQLERVLGRHALVFVVTSPKHLPAVRAAGTLFPWHTEARHVLYASEPLSRSTAGDGAAAHR
jgi:hypothetical protein